MCLRGFSFYLSSHLLINRPVCGEDKDCISLLGHHLHTFFSAASVVSVAKYTGYAVSHLPIFSFSQLLIYSSTSQALGLFVRYILYYTEGI